MLQLKFVRARTARQDGRRSVAYRDLLTSAAPLGLMLALASGPAVFAQSVDLTGDTDPLAAGDIDPTYDLMIGAYGVGTMTISGGAQITTASGSVGYDDGSDGEVLVTGGGSSWESRGSLTIGNFGVGRLRIEDKAKVLSVDAIIGSGDPGTGDAIVTGGAQWINEKQFTVGSYSAGTLLVEDGGKVSSNQGYIGAGSGSNGSVTVTGVGSSWVTTKSNINIGNFGTGALTIDDGGLVHAVTGVDMGVSDPTASGTLIMQGGAVLETSRISAGLGVVNVTIDDGLLRALANTSNFFADFAARDVTLGGGGVVVDTGAYNIAMAPRFVGTGGLTKSGAGRLILTGANTYAGATQVDAGRLEVNGDQSGAAGLTTVNAGATLGGVGVLGGDVVSIGGKIAPGSSGAPGVLTINGGLTLDAASSLDYRLGQAGTAGGLLNDLLVVQGDLTLDGVLNVTQSAGGVFGPGVYRLINYGGVLDDQGLSLGMLPGGGTKSVQTSILNQVNLVVTAPPGGGGGGGGGTGGGDPGEPPPPAGPFNFWDGASGQAADGVITGGYGVWRVGGAPIWARADGAANSAFQSGIFAIFSARPGVVAVDNAYGAISVSGMQFASDGYLVNGGAIGLEAGAAIIRVGDGSAAGETYRATLATELTGPGLLDKTDLGTLILTGANSYTGGTRVSSGVLQLGDGGTMGTVQGDVAVEGVLAFNRSDAMTFGGVISGGGRVRQIGSGVTTLSADSSGFSGWSEVRSGTLAVDGVLGGRVEVFDGGRLTGTGRVGALLTEAGGVVSPGHGVGVLTVAGDYESHGGTLQIEAVLGGDDSAADRLVVRGSTSGATLVEVAKLGGGGAQTADGILIVDVEGASEGVFTLASGDFRLGGENAIAAGAFAYVLRKDVEGGDWKLRSSINSVDSVLPPAGPGEPARFDPAQPQTVIYQPGVPVYEAYPETLRALNGLATMRQRIGDRRWSGEDDAGVWGRVEGGRLKVEPAVSTSEARLETDRWKVQFGVDRALGAVAGGQLVGALTAHYAEAKTSVASPHGDGRAEAKGYGLGATLTWTGEAGGYLDTQAQVSWYETDLRSDILGDRVEDADASGFAFSVEAGQTVAVGSTFGLTPQAQLTYSTVDFDSFVDPLGASVVADQGDSLLARLGVSLDRDWADVNTDGKGRLYGLANLTHEFLDGSRVLVSGTPIASRAERTWAGLAGGASYAWGAGRYLVYGEASAETPLSGVGDSYAVSGTAGLRVRF